MRDEAAMNANAISQLGAEGANRFMAPDFELKTLDDQTVRLSLLRGGVVLLNFWANWCGSCKTQLLWLAELQEQFTPQTLRVLAIVLDYSDKTTVALLLPAGGINYPILLGTDQLAETYGGMDILPATCLIDRSGKIVARFFGLTDRYAMENDILKALGS